MYIQNNKDKNKDQKIEKNATKKLEIGKWFD